MIISCNKCGIEYPLIGLPYSCQTCGSLYDFQDPLPFDPVQVDKSQPGIWKYQHTFGLPQGSEPVSLGEGSTPLLWAKVFGRNVAFKCEFLNPSGSFKDRGSVVITAWLRSRGIKNAIEDSSGNAGASLAEYAARTGIKVQIFIPESASGSKSKQIEEYGAELVKVKGDCKRTVETVRKVAKIGPVYASHASLPFNLPGYATIAYEIYEQLNDKMPAAVILPAGQGGLLLGIARGFDAIRIANNYKEYSPKIIGVQARACAPLWAKFSGAKENPDLYNYKSSLAEGVMIQSPVREAAVLRAVKVSHGKFCVATENEILIGRDALARLGFYIEPTSAIVWTALGQEIRELPDPVVVILTGSGYKD